MADVSQSWCPGDRGQLLLVGALALAVVFVALALLLNTAIYTGNLATRDSGVEATPAIEYVSESQQAGVDAVRSVNRRNNTSASDLNRAFNATMERWDDLASHHRAVAGDMTDTDVAGITNGTRIQQDDASRNFTSAGDAANWTVVDGSGVTAVRSMRFTVDASTLTTIDDATNATTETVFHVDVDSDLGTRSVYVYNNSTSGNSEILIDNDGTETVCSVGSVTDGTFVVDVANASVGGASCSALGTLDDTRGALSVEYGDGGAAGGTYTMVVDEGTDGNIALAGLNPDGSSSPYWTAAIYSAELTVTYRTGELDYEATVGVVPE